MEIFGSKERVHFHLNDYKDKFSMLNAVAVPYFTGGSTNTAAALHAMMDEVFDSNHVCLHLIS